jgi:hypothetical protein
MDILSTHIHGKSLSWLSTGTSIKSDEVNLFGWAQTTMHHCERMRSCKCFLHVSKILTHTYSVVNNTRTTNDAISRV